MNSQIIFFVEEDFFRVVTFFTAPLTADVVSTAVSFTFSTALFTVFSTVLEVPFEFFYSSFLCRSPALSICCFHNFRSFSSFFSEMLSFPEYR